MMGIQDAWKRWRSASWLSPRTPEPPAPEKLRLQEVLLVTHSNDPHAGSIVFNAEMALRYAGLPSIVHVLSDDGSLPALGSFAVVVLCTELIGELTPPTARDLSDFVRQGGGLVVAHRGWNEQLTECFGMKTGLDEPEMSETENEDFRFVQAVFPGVAGARLSPDQYCGNYGFLLSAADLSDKSEVLADDGNARPLCWKSPFGNGQTVFWNSVILSEKCMRGFLVQSILACRPLSAMRVIGFGMIQIDDSPPPVSDSHLEPISSEYPGMDANVFYHDIWYPDMSSLRSRYGLCYSHYSVINYEDGGSKLAGDNTYAASLFGNAIARKRFGASWREHLHQDDELGFHGYNHVPLISDNWGDPAAVDAAMKLARELWIDGVSERLPTSYVPAGNEFHPEQLKALVGAFPEITIVCSTYSAGHHDNGEFREFGPEPWHEALICLPRETAGYVMTDYGRIRMLSQLANFGVWTHYIHPDDIFDIPVGGEVTGDTRNREYRFWRKGNAQGQQGLYDCFAHWIGFARKHFPWIEFLTTSKAAERFAQCSGSMPAIAAGRKRLWINAETGGIYYLRVSGAMNIAPASTRAIEILDCQEISVGRLYVVKCRAGETDIDFF